MKRILWARPGRNHLVRMWTIVCGGQYWDGCWIWSGGGDQEARVGPMSAYLGVMVAFFSKHWLSQAVYVAREQEEGSELFCT